MITNPDVGSREGGGALLKVFYGSTVVCISSISAQACTVFDEINMRSYQDMLLNKKIY